MKTSKWKVIPIKGLIESRIATNEEFVGTVFNDFAPLVAAAPELLEACKELIYALKSEHGNIKENWSDEILKAEQAIKKAEEGGKCVAHVSDGIRKTGTHQCNRKKGYGYKSEYCKQHAKTHPVTTIDMEIDLNKLLIKAEEGK